MRVSVYIIFILIVNVDFSNLITLMNPLPFFSIFQFTPDNGFLFIVETCVLFDEYVLRWLCVTFMVFNMQQRCATWKSIYRVIQKDGLNFVRLYFLNYTWYVNDLHNIWKRRSEIFEYHRYSARLAHSRAAASVDSKMATMQHKIFCVREFIETESATAVQRAFRLRFNIQPPKRKSICRWNHQFEQIGLSV